MSQSPATEIHKFLARMTQSERAFFAYKAKQLSPTIFSVIKPSLDQGSLSVIEEDNPRIARRMVGCFHQHASQGKSRCVADVVGNGPEGSHRRCKQWTTCGTFYCVSHHLAVFGDVPEDLKKRRAAKQKDSGDNGNNSNSSKCSTSSSTD